MPFRQGRFTEVTVSGIDLSAYLDSAELSRDTEMLETTTFTKKSKTYLTGLTDGTFDISGKYDPTTPAGPQALLASITGSENSTAIIYYPGGNKAGQVVKEFNAYVTSLTESSEVGGVVEFDASLQIDGPVKTTVSGYISGITLGNV